jgi:hypothetical protein
MLPAASAEQDSHAQFFHDISVWTGEGIDVKWTR